jgi:hypothetical protein
MFEYKQLLLLKDTYLVVKVLIYILILFIFQHQLDICGSLRQLFSSIGV